MVNSLLLKILNLVIVAEFIQTAQPDTHTLEAIVCKHTQKQMAVILWFSIKKK